MLKRLVVLILVIALGAGLLVWWQQNRTTNEPVLVGNDKDDHGCILSAGYSWCEAKQKCLRPWEEACEPASGQSCGIENCHGLEVVCGSQPAEFCTEVYEIGDRCRQYAKCGFEAGSCQLLENRQFTMCRQCVEECLRVFSDMPDEIFECESACLET